MRSFLAAALLGLLSLPVTAPAAHSPQRLALLVGIDDYNGPGAPEVPEKDRWHKLKGCVTDTEVLRVELERRGFTVTVLTDAKATKKGILDAIQRDLAMKAKPGDIVLFHYSGHGQQITDDEANADEVDGYDESLVPYDNKGAYDGSANLRDDELGAAIATLTKITKNVVISLDSCHSGTGTRAMRRGGAAPAGEPLPLEKRSKAPATGDRNWTEANAGYVLLAAAQPNQLANEAKDPETQLPMGAFTLALVRALREADESVTYKQLMSRIGRLAETQHPQIEGDSEKLLFSGTWSAPQPGFFVKPVGADKAITLDAGTILGIHDGDEVGLYASSTAINPDKPLARAKVIRASPTSATAELLAEDANVDLTPLKRGANAVLRTVTYPAARLALTVPKSVPGRERLAALPFVDLTEEPTAVASRGAAPWDLRIVTDGSKFEIVHSDGSVVPIPVGPGLAPRMEIASLGGDTASALVQAVSVYQRRALLKGLANKDRTSNARVSLELVAVHAAFSDDSDGTGSWKITKEIAPLADDGSAEVAVGNYVGLLVTNDSGRAMHVAVIDLAADGSINILYPHGSRPAEILPPLTTRMIEIPIGICPPVGRETFKLIASEVRVDYAGLETKIEQMKIGVDRGKPVDGENSPIGRLFSSFSGATRGSKPVVAPARVSAWGTDSVDFTITGAKNLRSAGPGECE